ncbi:hypothetical protein BU26DRAFT_571458 [Trematosphaeria pertusa]|uniref:Uncharacterized protein n=1 Tax=Trematosphaeria pertusa TaxID=390896 RepID=A0A6A6HVB3_9PLEO|nr:uncharacterized protein BU26DRAFT_571458 [Trematosphaeria pertusa]KAF2241698.1 hypothetical protein BU26DRAFT_571458 [Trematosphaeria pertusa]
MLLRTSNAYKEIQDLLVALVSALQTLLASRFLHSRNRSKNLFHELLRLNSAASSDDFDIERIRPLLDVILNNEPDEVIWNKVYDAVTEYTPPSPSRLVHPANASVATSSDASR